METPFVFGKLASGIEFTNRIDKVTRLTGNFISGINTMIISPPEMGEVIPCQACYERGCGK